MKFYFDENLPHSLCKSLNEIEKRDGNNQCIYLPDKFAKGASDELIFDTLSEEQAIFVTQDYDFRKLQVKCELAKQKNVGVIHFKPPSKKCQYWQIVEIFFKHWIRLREASKKTKRPYVIVVTSKKVDTKKLS